MYIKNIYTIKIETADGPRYLVTTHAFDEHTRYLENYRKVALYHLRADGAMNPWGFGTLDEIRHFYDRERYVSGGVREPDYLQGYNRVATRPYGNPIRIPFLQICDMVTKSLEKPLTLESFFDPLPSVFMWVAKKDDETRYPDIELGYAIKKLEELQEKGYKLFKLVFNSYLVTKKERKEMEKSFFVIKLNTQSNTGADQYALHIEKYKLETRSGIGSCNQFKTENEAFKFISDHEPYFSATGYEVLEIPGMTLEKGLSEPKIPTL